jgi:hypothetical protein
MVEIYPEQIVLILGGIFILAWLELKLRIIARRMLQSSVQGIGIWMVIIGGVLIIASSFGLIEQQYGIYVAVGGAFVYVIGWALRIWGKREALEIEEERAQYLKRVRKGMTAKDAEKTAYDYLKSRVKGPLKKMGSVKEFKTWKVYFKGKDDKYMVVIDFDGDVANWESLGELPSWLKGPY